MAVAAAVIVGTVGVILTGVIVAIMIWKCYKKARQLKQQTESGTYDLGTSYGVELLGSNTNV